MARKRGNGGSIATFGEPQMADGAAGTTAGHEVGNRRAIIQGICREIDQIDGEIATLRQQKAEVKSRIKGELGMKVSDFNVALRLYKLEGEDRDAMLDTVRECFDALGVGDQLDWVAAAERQAERTAPPSADEERAEGEAVTDGPVGQPAELPPAA